MSNFQDFKQSFNKFVEDGLIQMEGKYNKHMYMKGDKQAKTYTREELIENEYFEFNKFKIKKYKLVNIIEKGDYVKYTTKKDKNKIKSGGFVRAVNENDKYFAVGNPYGTSFCVQFGDVETIYVKPIGNTRKLKLKGFIDGVDYLKQKEDEKKKKEEEKAQKGGAYAERLNISPLVEEQLRNLYYDQKNYFGRDKLFKLAQENEIQVTQRQLSQWLKDQKINQLTQAGKSHTTVKPIVAKEPFSHIQVDLIDFRKWEGNNNRKSYVMNAIDLYSKYAWSVPIFDKSAPRMVQAFRDLLRDMGRTPKIIQSDNGSEFVNEQVKQWMEENHIKQIFSHPYTPTSQGGIERFNKTIKAMIYKHMKIHNTTRWFDVLQQLVDNYNNTPHDVIGVAPATVDEKTRDIDRRLREEAQKKKVNKQVNVYEEGDYVRIKIKRPDIIAKGIKWGENIYRITKVYKPRNPLEQKYYKVNGKMYHAHDLLKVPPPEHLKDYNERARYIPAPPEAADEDVEVVIEEDPEIMIDL